MASSNIENMSWSEWLKATFIPERMLDLPVKVGPHDYKFRDILWIEWQEGVDPCCWRLEVSKAKSMPNFNLESIINES